jgi:transglutaminase-like putative cysteine protease
MMRGHVKNKTAPLALVVLAAIFALSQTVAVFGVVSERRFSYFPEESLSVRVDGSRFSVENLPARAAFDYGRIEFFTADGKNVKNEWTERAPDNSAGVDMAGLPDGLYTVDFCHSDERQANYTYYFEGSDVRLRVEGGEGSLLMPIMYERNAAFYEAERTDIAALSAYLTPTYGVQSDDPAVLSLAAELTEGLRDDYEKARAIHDFVAGNIWYDEDAARSGRPPDDDTALGALRLGRAVCEGYAKLNAALLRAAGIPAKYVHGYALGVSGDEWPSKDLNPGDSNHTWNEAFIDGRWVIIDATRDSGNSYAQGRKTESAGVRTYRYFDAVPEAFAADHATTDPEWELWWLPTAAPALANPFAGDVFVDGVSVRPAVCNIDGANYFKLRDVADMLKDTDLAFAVEWDAADKTISIRTDGAYAPEEPHGSAGGPGFPTMAALPDATVTIDGKIVYMSACNINGSNFFKLRDLGEAIGFSVDYIAPDPLYGAPAAVIIRTDAATREEAAAVIDKLVGSLTYLDGEVRFQIPTGVSNPKDLNIHISGRAQYDDGFGASLHFLEETNRRWVPGASYSVPCDAAYTDLVMTVSCPDEDGTIIERSVDLLSLK